MQVETDERQDIGDGAAVLDDSMHIVASECREAEQCRVVSDDVALTPARLKLVKAAQIVLVKVLNLMGVNAPERM